MEFKGQYSTSKLEKHINATYIKLEALAENDGIYKPIDIYFLLEHRKILKVDIVTHTKTANIIAMQGAGM